LPAAFDKKAHWSYTKTQLFLHALPGIFIQPGITIISKYDKFSVTNKTVKYSPGKSKRTFQKLLFD